MRKKFFNITLANILLGLILGIVLQHFYSFSQVVLIVLSILGITSLLVSFFFLKAYFSLMSLVLSAILGAITYYTHNEINQKAHYTHILKSNNYYKLNGDIQRIINSYTAEVLLISTDSIPLKGRIALSFGKDSLQRDMIGKNITFYSSLRPISVAKNPYQMDYKGYMQRKNILWHGKTEAFTLKDSPNTYVSVYGQKVQHFFIDKLNEYPFTTQSKGIINALLLGNRSQISPETYQTYIDAGAVHILAISGLHIGIITMIISSILNFFFTDKKHNLLKISFIILLLSGYSLLTGLSASVLRASVMFGFLSVGILLKKRQGSFDNILIAAFILLLFNPFFLFEVGFQLSFLAVTSIIGFQPIMNKFAPKKKIPLFIYEILSVSLVAQIGVLPISLYYFHQFPALFFLTNLFILPFLSFILGIGLVVIILAGGKILPLGLCFFYDSIIQIMNNVIGFIAHFEDFVLRNIYFDTFLLITSFAMLFLFWWGLYHKKHRFILYGIMSIFLIQGYLFFQKYQWQTSKSISVYYQYNQSVIFIKDGEKGYFINNDLEKIPSKIINFLEQKHQLSHISSQNTGRLFEFEGKKFLIINEPFYFDSPIEIDYLILQGNLKFHFEKFLQHCLPKHIITDGTSPLYLVKQWQGIAQQKSIPFHNGYEKGYFEEIY